MALEEAVLIIKKVLFFCSECFFLSQIAGSYCRFSHIVLCEQALSGMWSCYLVRILSLA